MFVQSCGIVFVIFKSNNVMVDVHLNIVVCISVDVCSILHLVYSRSLVRTKHVEYCG